MQFGASMDVKIDSNTVLEVANKTTILQSTIMACFTGLQLNLPLNLLEKLHFRYFLDIQSYAQYILKHSKISIRKKQSVIFYNSLERTTQNRWKLNPLW